VCCSAWGDHGLIGALSLTFGSIDISVGTIPIHSPTHNYTLSYGAKRQIPLMYLEGTKALDGDINVDLLQTSLHHAKGKTAIHKRRGGIEL